MTGRGGTILWRDRGITGDGSRLGPISFGSDASKHYEDDIRNAWFSYWLRDEGKLPITEATAFETGTNIWRQYDSWPPVMGVSQRRLFLQADRKLSFEMPARNAITEFDEYVSDPSNPVPYRPRPVTPTYPGAELPVWLVQDQRLMHHRPDVLSFVTDSMTNDLRVAGDITAELFASTSGTDSDWVVKLIDVYPEDAPADEKTKTLMGGYELIVADEIFRGKFRNSFECPEPVPADKPVRYVIDLHTNDHVFLKGHKVMVQVQSSWFPVYDRNPQQFIPNIFKASVSDYRKAAQKVFHSEKLPSAIVLPVLDER